MLSGVRAEHRLQRQRGAGARELAGVQFGFRFGSAVAPPPQPAEEVHVEGDVEETRPVKRRRTEEVETAVKKTRKTREKKQGRNEAKSVVGKRVQKRRRAEKKLEEGPQADGVSEPVQASGEEQPAQPGVEGAAGYKKNNNAVAAPEKPVKRRGRPCKIVPEPEGAGQNVAECAVKSKKRPKKEVNVPAVELEEVEEKQAVQSEEKDVQITPASETVKPENKVVQKLEDTYQSFAERPVKSKKRPKKEIDVPTVQLEQVEDVQAAQGEEKDVQIKPASETVKPEKLVKRRGRPPKAREQLGAAVDSTMRHIGKSIERPRKKVEEGSSQPVTRQEEDPGPYEEYGAPTKLSNLTERSEKPIRKRQGPSKDLEEAEDVDHSCETYTAKRGRRSEKEVEKFAASQDAQDALLEQPKIVAPKRGRKARVVEEHEAVSANEEMPRVKTTQGSKGKDLAKDAAAAPAAISTHERKATTPNKATARRHQKPQAAEEPTQADTDEKHRHKSTALPKRAIITQPSRNPRRQPLSERSNNIRSHQLAEGGQQKRGGHDLGDIMQLVGGVRVPENLTARDKDRRLKFRF